MTSEHEFLLSWLRKLNQLKHILKSHYDLISYTCSPVPHVGNISMGNFPSPQKKKVVWLHMFRARSCRYKSIAKKVNCMYDKIWAGLPNKSWLTIRNFIIKVTFSGNSEFTFVFYPAHAIIALKILKFANCNFMNGTYFFFTFSTSSQHMLFTNKPIKLFYMCNLSFFLK